MKISRLLILLLAAAMLLSMTGCGDSQTGGTGDAQNVAMSEAQDESDAESEADAQSGTSNSLYLWKNLPTDGGADAALLGLWKCDEEAYFLGIYPNKIVYTPYPDKNNYGMTVSYFVLDDWLGFGGPNSMTSEMKVSLQADGTLLVEGADKSLGFSSFPEGVFTIAEPLDFNGITDITSIADSDETDDDYGQPMLCYGKSHLTCSISYDWTMQAEEFGLFGSFINSEAYRPEGTETFRSYGFGGEKGVFSSADIDGSSQLAVLQAMGALSSGNEMRHMVIQVLHVQSYAGSQVIFLSLDSDGVGHIAALTYNRGADAYEWDGETYETRDMCGVSRYGRFCYVDGTGAIASTLKL